MFRIKPNKSDILDDFIVVPWTFDVSKSRSWKPVMRVVGDLYHHITNLIYNNDALPTDSP